MADEPKTDTPPEPSGDKDAQRGESSKVFTQKELDHVVGERLARERERFSDYDELKNAAQRLSEIEDRDKSELEKLTGKLGKAEQAKAEAEAKLLRFEVAAEKNVPADAIDLLTGNTREELEAKADKLLDLVKSRSETEKTPDFDGGAREPAPEPKSAEEQHNEEVLKLLGLAPN